MITSYVTVPRQTFSCLWVGTVLALARLIRRGILEERRLASWTFPVGNGAGDRRVFGGADGNTSTVDLQYYVLPLLASPSSSHRASHISPLTACRCRCRGPAQHLSVSQCQLVVANSPSSQCPAFPRLSLHKHFTPRMQPKGLSIGTSKMTRQIKTLILQPPRCSQILQFNDCALTASSEGFSMLPRCQAW